MKLCATLAYATPASGFKPDALARLLEGPVVPSDRAVAGGQVRAGNEVARVGLFPQLQRLDGPVAVVVHVHVVARRDVEPLALAHPLPEVEGPLRDLRGQVVLLRGAVGDAQRGVGDGEVGIQLDRAPVEGDRLEVLAAEVPLPAQVVGLEGLQGRSGGLLDGGGELLDGADRLAQLLAQAGRGLAEPAQDLLPALGLDLLAHDGLAGGRVDRFQADDVMPAEAARSSPSAAP